jgi:hypothetical protein
MAISHMAKRQKNSTHETYNDVGLEDVTEPPTGLRRMGKQRAIEAITDWFWSNFEDPVHSVSYDSGEGGYLYVWGPYDAQDVIESVFGERVSEAIVKAAVDEIEAEGFDWVPNSSRRLPPFEDEEFAATYSAGTPVSVDFDLSVADPVKAHAELRRRIEALEKLLAGMPNAGIGHNNPPERIGEVVFSVQDRNELQKALSVLKQSEPVPSDQRPVQDAVAVVEKKSSKIADTRKRRVTFL